MKKKLLFVAMLLTVCGYAQNFTESFEGNVFPPPGWEVYQNEVGIPVFWGLNPPNNPNRPAHTGNRAAFLDRLNTSSAVNPQDWLITPAMIFTAENSAISFFSRLTIPGNQGTTYQIMILPANQSSDNLGAYVPLQTWTEFQINPVQEEYTQQIVPIPAPYYGTAVRIAFVMTSVNNGDRWLIDDIGIASGCQAPFSLTVSDITSSSAILSWGVYNATQWEVVVLPIADAFTGGAGTVVTTNSFEVTGLTEGDYKFYVRALCDNGEASNWSQGFNFTIGYNNVITGTLRYDANGDTVCDAVNILPNTEIQVSINETDTYSIYTNNQGMYILYGLPLGSGAVVLQPVLPAGFPVVAPTVQDIVLTPGQDNLVIDICLPQPEIVYNTSVTVIPVGQSRPGFNASYQVIVKNNNVATITNAVATLSFDNNRLDFVSAQAPGITTGNTITFNAGTLNPFETRMYNIVFYVLPPDTNIGGETLVFNAAVVQDQTDAYPDNNTAVLNQEIVNSYDPNDITVHEGAFITEDQKDNYLTYTIRFQNTGTAEAINIRLENIPDDKLDLETFEPLISSHSYITKRTGNVLEFMYNNINLPDSTANEAASHGYVTYRIKPKTTVNIGDVFLNSAGIYFDFNAPVLTNTVTTEIIENLGIKEDEIYSTAVYPNPVKNTLYIGYKNGDILQNVSVYDSTGKLCLNIVNANNSINVQALPAGLYFVKVTTQKGLQNHKIIKQ